MPIIADKMGVETHLNLFHTVFLGGESRKLIFGKITTFGSFDILNKGTADNGTRHKNLTHTIGIVRDIMLSPILYGYNSICDHIKSSFFLNFFYGIFCNRHIHITPATGERPSAVIFVNK